MISLMALAGCQPETELYINKFDVQDTSPAVGNVNITLDESMRFPPGTELRILQWNHFVPGYDVWFDQFAAEWGEQHGVEVTVDRFDFDKIENALEQELERGDGHTMIELLFPPSAWIEDLHDLTDINKQAIELLGEQKDSCRFSSYLPNIDSYYAFCHGYAPSPGNYLIDEWTAAGYPQGPSNYQELLVGGQKVAEQTGMPIGLGISPEIDSEIAMRSIIWSHGGSIQDQNENVVLYSPETIEAVEFISQLFKQSMSESVLEWVPSSNNQGILTGDLSYIQNSLSAYRSMQKEVPERSANVAFTKPLEGPEGAIAPAHVWMIYVVPLYVEEMELLAAKAFMLHLAANYNQAVYNSELYNFPAWASTTPQLYAREGWLNDDPFSVGESERLSILTDAGDIYVNLGYPGYANPAIGQVFDEKIITQMIRRVVVDNMSAEESVKIADQRTREIFEIWREKGLVGGSQ
ncbi:MAG: ABC transporter substrate-binding protein [Chloroflexota bacterium]